VRVRFATSFFWLRAAVCATVSPSVDVVTQPVALCEGFERPTFLHDVDLERYLAACPGTATTRGTFFEHVREHACQSLQRDPEGLYEGAPRRTWEPFSSYPLAEFMRLAHNAARLVYPDRPTSDGLRRIGQLSFPSFAATTAGRVVLYALGDGMDDVLKVGPTAYRLTLPSAVVNVRQVSERRYRYEMRSVHSFVDTFHYGVFEGVALALKHELHITLRRQSRLCDADFEVAW
jgi:uncharacterized protein (TIGR02265 family)